MSSKEFQDAVAAMFNDPLYTVLDPTQDLTKLSIEQLNSLYFKYREYFENLQMDIRNISETLKSTPPSSSAMKESLEKSLNDANLKMMDAKSSMELVNTFGTCLSPSFPTRPAALNVDKPSVVATNPNSETGGATPVVKAESKGKKGKRSDPESTNGNDWVKPSKKQTIPVRKIKKPTKEINISNSFDNIPIDEDPSGSNVDMEDIEYVAPQPKRVGKKPPPIFFIPNVQWREILARGKQVAPSIRSKLYGKFMRILVDDHDQYRAFTHILKMEMVQFKSYLLDDQKPFKIVLRGLPISTDVKNIKIEIEQLGYDCVNVTQLYRGSKNKSIFLPLFLIETKKDANSANLFSVTELMGTEVNFEKFRGKKGPRQCHTCQGYFHTAAACHLSPKCVKCAGDHKTADCSKAFDTPCKCANCGGDHPANYRSCPKFPSDKRQNSKNDNSKTVERTFSKKKVDESFSFAEKLTGKQKSKFVPNSAVNPQINDPAVFLKYLLALEARYAPTLILAAFKRALPALRLAETDIDRQYLLYESVTALSDKKN